MVDQWDQMESRAWVRQSPRMTWQTGLGAKHAETNAIQVAAVLDPSTFHYLVPHTQTFGIIITGNGNQVHMTMILALFQFAPSVNEIISWSTLTIS